MKYEKLCVGLLVATVALGCGDLGDSDLETQVGDDADFNNSSNNDGEPVSGFSEDVAVVVSAKHLVTPTDGTRIIAAESSNADVVGVVGDVGNARSIEIECLTAAEATVDITLESTSNPESTANGELVVTCMEPEELTLSPQGYTIFSPTKRIPYEQTIVTTTPELRVRYDVYASGDRLAGYAYDPFESVRGVDYESLPQQLGAGSSSQGRYVELTVDQQADAPEVDTVMGQTLPVEVIEPTDVEAIAFYNIQAEELESGDPGLAGEIIQVEGLWQSEPVQGVGAEIVSLTPDVCEASSIGELTEEEGDDTLPVFVPGAVANGTCEVQATIVGTDTSATLTFEITGQ